MRIKLKMPKFKVKLKHLRKKYKHPVKGINNEIDQIMTLDSHEIRLGNSYKIELGDGTYKIGLINLEDIENLLDDEIDDFYQALELDENVLL